MKIIITPNSFEWDSGNKDKNLVKHNVSNFESEEVFFDPKKIIAKKTFNRHKEKRYILLGKTKMGRLLFIVFTIRRQKIRIISARDLNKKERHLYG